MANLKKYYAGIGSRETPAHILNVMTKAATWLGNDKWILRSGGAIGADHAFNEGAFYYVNLYLPVSIDIHETNEKVLEEAIEHSYNFNLMKTYVKKLMIRNIQIILGKEGNNPVSFVLCWTPDGKDTGGTGVGIRVANKYNIPVYNLHDPKTLDKITKRIGMVLL